ncbi:MAG: preprotein translocase subunit SecA [bacterium]
MSIFSAIFGDDNTRQLKPTGELVLKINAFEPVITALSDSELCAKTPEFKARLKAGESLDDILPEAFAVVREAAKRTLGQRHYDVQLIGGIMLHQGKIAEMRTGEGKTQVATLPVYLNALTGRGVHVVTVNDYLARRDTVWMGQIYVFLGLSVGVINHESSYLYDATIKNIKEDEERDDVGSFKIIYDYLRPCSRHEAYRADITYGTNNEFGFDYLRDNLAYHQDRVAQTADPVTGRYYFAIIDEVDSILIDEARTPLIISAPVGESESLYDTFSRIASTMVKDTDYTVDEKLKAIQMTGDGIDKAEKALGVGNIYSEMGIKYVHHLETAVRAKALFERDKDYVVKEGEVIIVDEFTGRLQPGRRWSEGLDQAIEAKEGVKVQEESRTFATVTLQNYFRLYEKLSGMTGTAQTSAEEFMKVYGLPVVSIPTNVSSQRADLADLIFQSEKGKYIALTRRVKELQEKGQPVLIGTTSIEKNELLSAYFSREGVSHKMLNAKNHEAEGEIIAGAGRKGSVVIATNMAGRGVDIKLGGPNPTKEQQQEIRDLGGLYVIGTERHEARRIDNQLRGRSGRQGDPGTTQFYVSLDDTLMRIFGSDRVRGMMARLGIPEDEPIQNNMVSKAIESAQSKIEGMNFDTRKHLLDYDDVTNLQRLTTYDRRRHILFGGKESVDDFLAKAKISLGMSEEEIVRFDGIVESKKKELGDDEFYRNAEQIILQVVDMYWVEHLEAIEYMRNSVRLRAYGQRDPLVEFKREGLNLFKQLEASVSNSVLSMLETVGAPVRSTQTIELEAVHEGAESLSEGGGGRAGNETRSDNQVGRNDPCPCGSGKKYKKCGLLNTEEHQRLSSK